MINKIENAVIHKYGYEHKMTIIVFWVTHLMRKIWG